MSPAREAADTAARHLINDLLERDEQERRALQLLLDRRLDVPTGVVAQKHRMGIAPSYLGTMTLRQFAHDVEFSSKMPFLRNFIDAETGQVRIDNDTIDVIAQRPLDWTRRIFLAAYLAGRKYRKFPPVVAVVTQPWVDDPDADEWGSDWKATRSSVSFDAFDTSGHLGIVALGQDARCYALDGQHRLMGVKGLVDLVMHDEVDVLNRKGRRTGRMTSAAFCETYRVDPTVLPGILDETIGVELIPAVVEGETREQARRRIRSVFVHTNRMAVHLTAGQVAQLDEDDGFAIVARRTATTHPVLQRDGKPLVNWDTATIAPRSALITTLQTLKEMAYSYLSPIPPYSEWRGNRQLVAMRPDDDDLDDGKDRFDELWSAIGSLPSFQQVHAGTSTSMFRRFSFEDPPGQGHLLFRPVGQVVLAEAAGRLMHDYGMSIREITDGLGQLEDGRFALDDPSTLWWGVLYNPFKRRMMIAGRPLAVRLLVYLLTGDRVQSASDRDVFDDWVAARTIEEQVFGLNGEPLGPRQRLKLPDPL